MSEENLLRLLREFWTATADMPQTENIIRLRREADTALRKAAARPKCVGTTRQRHAADVREMFGYVYAKHFAPVETMINQPLVQKSVLLEAVCESIRRTMNEYTQCPSVPRPKILDVFFNAQDKPIAADVIEKKIDYLSNVFVRALQRIQDDRCQIIS